MKTPKMILTAILGSCLFVSHTVYAKVSVETLAAANTALDAYESGNLAQADTTETQVQAEPVVANTTAEIAPSAAIVTPVAATAEENKTIFGDLLKKYDINPSGSVTLDYYNRYVWRGQYLDRDGVLEPGISLTAKNLTVGYWSNWDIGNEDTLNSSESDGYVSYAYTLDPVTITGGHTWYSFPGTKTSSKEFFISAGVSTILSPVVSFFHDYEDGKDLGMGNGNYYSLSLSHSIDLEKKSGVSLTVGTTLGYVDHQWINGTGWHFTPTVAVNIPITKSMTISPTVGYNLPEGDLKDPNIGNQEKHMFGGVHTVISF